MHYHALGPAVKTKLTLLCPERGWVIDIIDLYSDISHDIFSIYIKKMIFMIFCGQFLSYCLSRTALLQLWIDSRRTTKPPRQRKGFKTDVCFKFLNKKANEAIVLNLHYSVLKQTVFLKISYQKYKPKVKNFGYF